MPSSKYDLDQLVYFVYRTYIGRPLFKIGKGVIREIRISKNKITYDLQHENIDGFPMLLDENELYSEKLDAENACNNSNLANVKRSVDK